MNRSDSELRREGKYLFRALFPPPPPVLLLDRYVEAHAALKLDPAADSLMGILIRHNLDAQAVEYVLRLRSQRNSLTIKMGIVCFLAESDGHLWRHFWTVEKNRPAALRAMARLCWEVPFRYLKGVWLVRRYHLA